MLNCPCILLIHIDFSICFERKCHILYLCQVVAVVHVCIWLLEDIPLVVIGTGFLANVVYALLLKDFPFISLTSFRFLSAIGKDWEYGVWVIEAIQ